jgi:hypothetical protein
MRTSTNWANRLCCIGLVASTLVVVGVGPVFAEQPGKYSRDNQQDSRGDRNDQRGDQRGSRDDRSGKRDNQQGSRDDRKGKQDDHRGSSDNRNEGRDVRWGRESVAWGKRMKPDPNYEREREPWERRRTTPQTYYRDYHRPPQTVYRGVPRGVPHNRMRRYRDVVVVRPYGQWYPGYGHYYQDNDAYKWLAFTAITLGILNYMNEAQQREYEAAQIAAVTAPIGEPIIWREGDASGAVIATREGTTPSGRYCREFQHHVTIGGRTEEAYGTACLNPDGSWEVVSGDD